MTVLKDICKFQSGGTPAKSNKEYYGGNIPWITTVSLTGSAIDSKNAVDWITDKAIIESAAKIVPANSIMVGTRVGVGKTALNLEPMSTNQDIISLLDIDETRWDKRFLCIYIQSKSAYLSSQARGATIKGIKIDELASLVVPDFSIEKQQIISQTFEIIKSVLVVRKNEIYLLDELIKARFVEMFFDKGYPVLQWNDVFNTTTGKLDSNAMVEDGEYPFFTCAKEVFRIDKYAFDQEALLLAGNNAAGK